MPSVVAGTDRNVERLISRFDRRGFNCLNAAHTYRSVQDFIVDCDAVRVGHTASVFEYYPGGQADVGWAGEGTTPNRYAVIPQR